MWKKGRPVDKGAEGGEREVIEDVDAGGGGGGDVFGAPLDGGAAGASGGERHDGFGGLGVAFAEGVVVGVRALRGRLRGHRQRAARS